MSRTRISWWRRATVTVGGVAGAVALLLGGAGHAAAAAPAQSPTVVVGDNNPTAVGCSDLTAVTTVDGYTSVFWVSPVGQVWDAVELGSNHAYTYHQIASGGGVCNADIAAVSRAAGQADVFWVTENGSIEHASVTLATGATQAQTLEPAGRASVSGSLAAVSRAPNTWEIFWVTPKGAIDDRYWYSNGATGAFQLFAAGPSSPSSLLGRQIAVVSRASNTMEVFWVGQDGSIEDSNYYDGLGWNHFELSAARSAASPTQITAVSRASNTMELWWIGEGSQLHGAFWFAGSNWAQYTLAGTFGYGTLDAVAPSASQMDVFFPGGFDDAYQVVSGPPWGSPTDLPSSGYQTSFDHDISAVSGPAGGTQTFVVTQPGAIIEYDS